ncbi:hypothetical protein ABZ490_02905 [Streptomyces sp. NPDC005811]|uniref:hypothetical protein n=1 Tax=Streptomyces sp. NPDC005811 TaxID=3154565 RepID=UPI00340CD10B
MRRGDRRRVRAADLRLGAAMAEVEGLYAAVLRAGTPGRRRRLQAELSRAAGRLADLAAPPSDPRARTAVRRSRWGRRRALAERGAERIIARYGRGAS